MKARATVPTPTASDNSSRFKNGHLSVICDDALRHPDFPHHAFITYWAISTFAAAADKANAGECRVGQGKLAQRAGISARTLRDHVRALADAGFIYSKRTGRTSILTVTGDRCHGRIPIGGEPAARNKPTARQQGYAVADELEARGTNYRLEGFSERTRHAVANVASRCIGEGCAADDVDRAMESCMDEYALVPSVSELRALMSPPWDV